MKLRMGYKLVIALCVLALAGCVPQMQGAPAPIHTTPTKLGAQYGVNMTVRQLNIGTETSPGVVVPPGVIDMNGNPINGLPIAVQSGQPCTYGNVSGGCNNGGGGEGSGTVGSGTSGQVGYYPSTGTSIAGAGTNNHGLFAYESGSAPNTIVASGAGQVLVSTSGDPVYLVMTGDTTNDSGFVTTTTKLNHITPGGNCASHQWVNALTSSAVPSCTQPAFSDISGLLNLGTQTTGTISLTSQVSGVLPIANGGNGSSTPSLIAGAGITLTGTWPNYTIAAPATGTVTAVNATSPLASSGGTTPTISIINPLPVANGGTQCGAPVPFASLPGSPTVGQVCTVTDENSCTAGTNGSGGGSIKCAEMWNGANWRPGGGVISAATGGVTSVTATSPVASSGGATPNITLGTVPVNKGGTNATAAGSTAANNIGAAELGANSSITSLTGLTTPLPVAEGGTGTTTPGLIAGSNTTITGSWPNQTISSSGGGGNCGNTTLTTISGTTAGTASCYTPCQGTSYKLAVCSLSGYQNSTGTTQTYTFNGGTTFSITPPFVYNSNPPSAASTTAISLPINQTAPFTGYVEVSGF